MHKLSVKWYYPFIIAFLILSFFNKDSLAQNCWIEKPPPLNYILVTAPESLAVGELLGNYSTVDVQSISLEPPNAYIEFILVPTDNTIEFRLLKPLSESLDEGIDEFSVNLNLLCADSTSRTVIVETRIEDENNKAPEFSNSDYTISIQNPWPLYLPINVLVPILVTDQDFNSQNAELVFETSEPLLFRAIGTRATSVSPYEYSVQIVLLGQIDSDTVFNIIADDGVNIGMSSISLTVSTANIKAPEFSNIYYRSFPIVNPEVGMQVLLTEDIKATDPENTNFEFSISGPEANLVEPDLENPDKSILKLKFKDTTRIEDLENGVAIITITATETDGDSLATSSTVILFFDLSTSNTGTATASTSSVASTATSSDCPDFTTFVTEPSSCAPCNTEATTPIECATSTTPGTCTPCPSPSTEIVSSCPPCSSSSTTELVTGSTCPDVCSSTSTDSSSASSASTEPSSGPSSIVVSSSSSSSDRTTASNWETESTTSCNCESITCLPCQTTEKECDDDGDGNGEDCCKKSSNVGFVAGLVVTSILFAASALGFGYLWFSLRKLRSASSLMKNLTPIEKWNPPVRNSTFTLDNHNYRKPSVTFSDNVNIAGPGPLPRPSISKHRLSTSTSRVSESSLGPTIKTSPPAQESIELIEATNEQVLPEPKPDYRTRPDYNVRIQEAPVIIPDKEIEYAYSPSDGDGESEASGSKTKDDGEDANSIATTTSSDESDRL